MILSACDTADGAPQRASRPRRPAMAGGAIVLGCLGPAADEAADIVQGAGGVLVAAGVEAARLHRWPEVEAQLLEAEDLRSAVRKT